MVYEVSPLAKAFTSHSCVFIVDVDIDVLVSTAEPEDVISLEVIDVDAVMSNAPVNYPSPPVVYVNPIDCGGLVALSDDTLTWNLFGDPLDRVNGNRDSAIIPDNRLDATEPVSLLPGIDPNLPLLIVVPEVSELIILAIFPLLSFDNLDSGIDASLEADTCLVDESTLIISTSVPVLSLAIELSANFPVISDAGTTWICPFVSRFPPITFASAIQK